MKMTTCSISVNLLQAVDPGGGLGPIVSPPQPCRDSAPSPAAVAPPSFNISRRVRFRNDMRTFFGLQGRGLQYTLNRRQPPQCIPVSKGIHSFSRVGRGFPIIRQITQPLG